MFTPHTLPTPSEAALAHSNTLQEHIKNTIQAAGGAIPFHQFMQIALYEPGLGYYVAGNHKIGTGGDFTTAPEISPLFSKCLAQQCITVLKAISHGTILELGAGSGKMAVDLLSELQAQEQLPERYLILELSPDLKQRQQNLFQRAIPELTSRIQWLDQLPATPIRGIILANEVVDAMPVERFSINSDISNPGIDRWHVGLDPQGTGLSIAKEKASTEIENTIREQCGHLLKNRPQTAEYYSEFNPQIPAWCQAISNTLESGSVIVIDYGYEQQDYYHPQRSQGTFLCHYQQHVHDNALLYPGLQDLTASVNFSALSKAFEHAGLNLTIYTTQAQFLIQNGLENFFNQQIKQSPEQLPQLAQQVRILTLPGEMGERFKVMLLTKGFTSGTDPLRLTPSSMGDLRYRL